MLDSSVVMFLVESSPYTIVLFASLIGFFIVSPVCQYLRDRKGMFRGQVGFIDCG